jgi:hypothetical protein
LIEAPEDMTTVMAFVHYCWHLQKHLSPEATAAVAGHTLYSDVDIVLSLPCQQQGKWLSLAILRQQRQLLLLEIGFLKLHCSCVASRNLFPDPL